MKELMGREVSFEYCILPMLLNGREWLDEQISIILDVHPLPYVWSKYVAHSCLAKITIVISHKRSHLFFTASHLGIKVKKMLNKLAFASLTLAVASAEDALMTCPKEALVEPYPDCAQDLACSWTSGIQVGAGTQICSCTSGEAFACVFTALVNPVSVMVVTSCPGFSPIDFFLATPFPFAIETSIALGPLTMTEGLKQIHAVVHQTQDMFVNVELSMCQYRMSKRMTSTRALLIDSR